MHTMSEAPTYRSSAVPRMRPHGTRAAILRAAQDLFGERPWGAVSMESIAERSGFSRRTVYNQFIDCSELYRATREALIRDISQHLPHEVERDATATPSAALRSYCNRVASALGSPSHVELFRSMVRDGWANQWLLDDYNRWVRDPVLRSLENFLYDMVTKHRIEDVDIKRNAQELVADIESLVVTPQMAPGLLSINHARNESVDGLVTAFVARMFQSDDRG